MIDQNHAVISCPYDYLYIYHIDGIVKNDDGIELGKSFIGSWVEDSFSFLFFNKPSSEKVNEFLLNRRTLSLIDDYCFSYDQWQGGGHEIVKVENIRIIPPWRKIPIEENTIDILLDPGVVFGNGVHPTTRDCLKAILSIKDQKPFNHVLDIGTGTGILSLTSAYLGANSITAIDLNPLCVKTALRNVALNNMENKIKVFEGAAEDYIDESADLVLANIHYDVILNFFQSGSLRNKNKIIISGLMRSQARDLKNRMGVYGFEILREWEHEMTWYTMIISRDEDDDT